MIVHKQNDPTLNKIVDIIVRTVSPKKIILFGSRARGDNTENSDYDIFILKDSNENERKITTRVYKQFYEEHINKEIDLIAASTENMIKNLTTTGFIYKNINEEGVVLYE
ncbi:MAG: nucleotidyltransferase domain-containing protein [Sphaerochaetaceae bacterium]|nr:nucleotidyltransferase domain-containing protein [Sphaerochaetaceae bacterium]